MDYDDHDEEREYMEKYIMIKDGMFIKRVSKNTCLLIV